MWFVLLTRCQLLSSAPQAHSCVFQNLAEEPTAAAKLNPSLQLSEQLS
jgi:hypothetical protein